MPKDTISRGLEPALLSLPSVPPVQIVARVSGQSQLLDRELRIEVTRTISILMGCCELGFSEKRNWARTGWKIFKASF